MISWIMCTTEYVTETCRTTKISCFVTLIWIHFLDITISGWSRFSAILSLHSAPAYRVAHKYKEAGQIIKSVWCLSCKPWLRPMASGWIIYKYRDLDGTPNWQAEPALLGVRSELLLTFLESSFLFPDFRETFSNLEGGNPILFTLDLTGRDKAILFNFGLL